MSPLSPCGLRRGGRTSRLRGAPGAAGPQPQGITLARIDGPTTDDVTMRESGECEITPSTDVKYPQGSITSPHNQWLLIGVDPEDTGVPCTLMLGVSGGGSHSCWGVLGGSPSCSAQLGEWG